jgi:hypothetical protein
MFQSERPGRIDRSNEDRQSTMWRAVPRASGRCRVSDEELVERLRRGIARFDRWRRPLLVLYLVGAAVFIGAVVAATVLLQSLSRGLGNRHSSWAGFLLGVVIGSGLGITAAKIGHGIVDILLGYRNERLLIKYHDALEQLRRNV